MADYQIDALLPWVDGDDPALKAKRSKYMTTVASGNDDVAGATRYKSIGEIKYCVASILRFAPFVRKIFIMTDGQDPKLGPFIEKNFPEQSSKIEIIDHSVIFKGYEEALPVFNSNAIEAVMWNIPEMAEHILYFNDDFMLTAPVRPEDFFPERLKPLTRSRMSSTQTAAAARKILAFGRKLVVPSSLVMVAAPLSTAAPMPGPITPGISTCPKIRIP